MSRIEVFEDPRYPGEFLACDGDLFWWVDVDAEGRVVCTNNDPTHVPGDVADAVKSHIDPSYVAPDYHSISCVI